MVKHLVHVTIPECKSAPEHKMTVEVVADTAHFPLGDLEGIFKAAKEHLKECYDNDHTDWWWKHMDKHAILDAGVCMTLPVNTFIGVGRSDV